MRTAIPASFIWRKKNLPVFEGDGIRGRVLLGDFHGEKSPIETQWNTLYVDIHIHEGGEINIPDTTEERAIYAIKGRIEINHTVDGPRYIYWNFVASSRDRLEQAKEDWSKGRFKKVPGDDREFIPLPQ